MPKKASSPFFGRLLAISLQGEMPDVGCDLVYTCGLATKACMAQRSVVLLLLNNRLWVQLSVVHFFANSVCRSLPESAGVHRSPRTLADSTDSGRLRQTPLQESAGLSPVKVLRSPWSLADSGRSPAGLKQQIWPMSHQHSPGFESCRSPPDSAGVCGAV